MSFWTCCVLGFKIGFSDKQIVDRGEANDLYINADCCYWCIPVSYTHLTLPTSDLV